MFKGDIGPRARSPLHFDPKRRELALYRNKPKLDGVTIEG